MPLGSTAWDSHVQRALPLPEILLVRKLGRRAADRARRNQSALVEEADIEIPEQTIGGVVEAEPMVGAEDGDARGELVEGTPMGIHHARELGAHPLRLGRVDADAGAAAGCWHGDDVEAAALPRDYGRSRPGRTAPPVGAQQLAARGAIEQLIPLDGLGGVLWPRPHARRPGSRR